MNRNLSASWENEIFSLENLYTNRRENLFRSELVRMHSKAIQQNFTRTARYFFQSFFVDLLNKKKLFIKPKKISRKFIDRKKNCYLVKIFCFKRKKSVCVFWFSDPSTWIRPPSFGCVYIKAVVFFPAFYNKTRKKVKKKII